MDNTERLVHEFLIKRGYQDIVYEPDGNVPPDFLVDRRIAVEVRRLNQTSPNGTEIEGLEKIAIPLWKNVKELALSIGPSNGETWFVALDFGRPVERWKTLRKKMRAALLEFMNSTPRERKTIEIAPNVEIELFRASAAHPTFFVMGAQMDDESGGWLMGEIEKHVKMYIEEKTAKIRDFRMKYPVWWLMLVDYIGYGLDDDDIEELKAGSISHEWDRVIVVSPNNLDRYFDI